LGGGTLRKTAIRERCHRKKKDEIFRKKRNGLAEREAKEILHLKTRVGPPNRRVDLRKRAGNQKLDPPNYQSASDTGFDRRKYKIAKGEECSRRRNKATDKKRK